MAYPNRQLVLPADGVHTIAVKKESAWQLGIGSCSQFGSLVSARWPRFPFSPAAHSLIYRSSPSLRAAAAAAPTKSFAIAIAVRETFYNRDWSQGIAVGIRLRISLISSCCGQCSRSTKSSTAHAGSAAAEAPDESIGKKVHGNLVAGFA